MFLWRLGHGLVSSDFKMPSTSSGLCSYEGFIQYSSSCHLQICISKKYQAFYTLRMLGPFNGRVGTCIAGVRLLKIAVFEGSGFYHAGSISTWITKQRQQGTRNVFLQWLAFTSSFKASSSTTWQTNISNISKQRSLLGFRTIKKCKFKLDASFWFMLFVHIIYKIWTNDLSI